MSKPIHRSDLVEYRRNITKFDLTLYDAKQAAFKFVDIDFANACTDWGPCSTAKILYTLRNVVSDRSVVGIRHHSRQFIGFAPYLFKILSETIPAEQILDNLHRFSISSIASSIHQAMERELLNQLQPDTPQRHCLLCYVDGEVSKSNICPYTFKMPTTKQEWYAIEYCLNRLSAPGVHYFSINIPDIHYHRSVNMQTDESEILRSIIKIWIGQQSVFSTELPDESPIL